MNKITVALILNFTFCIFNSAFADYWTQKADFGGTGRFLSIYFQANNKGYIGCGYDTTYYALKDFWEYDPVSNTWTQKADFGGGTRAYAGSFSIGNKGYTGFGCDSTGDFYGDFWEYDALTNIWTQKTGTGAVKRLLSIGFGLGNKGYLGGGFSLTSILYDLWEYDTLTDSWTQLVIPSFVNIGNFGLTIGNKGYTGFGIDQTGAMLSSFFEYDPQSGVWTQKADFPLGYRDAVACFSVNGKGYLGTGTSPGNLYNDFWEYDPLSNQWSQKAGFPGVPRNGTASFSINNKGYIGVGKNVTNLPVVTTYKDFWEYTPDSTTGINEFEASGSKFEVAPNPASQYTIISWQSAENKKMEITVTDANGKRVFETQLQAKTLSFKLETSNFAPGIYFVTVDNGKEKTVKKFIKN